MSFNGIGMFLRYIHFTAIVRGMDIWISYKMQSCWSRKPESVGTWRVEKYAADTIVCFASVLFSLFSIGVLPRPSPPPPYHNYSSSAQRAIEKIFSRRCCCGTQFILKITCSLSVATFYFVYLQKSGHWICVYQSYDLYIFERCKKHIY